MSETATEQQPAEADAQEQKPGEQATTETPPTFTQEQVNAMIAEQKRKEREKFSGYDDLKAKAAEFDKLQEASKTEQQRAAEAAQKAQEEAAAARADAFRYKAAATHGIGEDYFDLLGSGDEESISARAEKVGGLLKSLAELEQLRAEVEVLRAGKPAPTTGTPVPALKPGATAEQIPGSDDTSYPSHWLPQRQQ